LVRLPAEPHFASKGKQLKEILKSKVKPLIPRFVIRYKLDRARSSSILLTFDNGPHPSITPRVLDVLDKYGARALFFVVGQNAQKSPGLIEEIVRRKHGLGNHTFSHNTCVQRPVNEIVDDIAKCSDEVFRHSGVRTILYRPCSGVTRSQLLAAWRSKHSILKWTVDSNDVTGLKHAPPIEVAEKVMAQLHERAVILCHDSAEITPNYLEILLPRLLDCGMDLKSGLSSLVH
jgi:peptidoglycan/xylan/chitin deacetylase (PgdA/CDA1 family)